MPVSLSDAERAAVQAAAAPIHPSQRDDFLKAMAKVIERLPVVGPGAVHRCAAELQKKFVVTGHSETAMALRDPGRVKRPAKPPDDRRALAPSTPNRRVRKR
jgi:hypothetical protein